MDRSHVVLMVLDASEGVTDQDLAVAGYAYEKGRAVILLVNKWDLPEKDDQTMGKFVEEVRRRFKFLPFAPLLFVSALTGQRVNKVMALVESVAAEFNRRIPTPALNQGLEEIVSKHPPAMVHGRRIKFYYAAQSGRSFRRLLCCLPTTRDDIHFSYQRYLTNGFPGKVQV